MNILKGIENRVACRMRRLMPVFVLLFIPLILFTGNASAAGNNHYKWELGLSPGFNISFLDTAYNHDYSPIFRKEAPDDYISTASQQLNIVHSKKMEPGVCIMLNHLVSEKIGIQLLAQFHKTELEGTGNQYYNYLEYTAYLYGNNFQPATITREYDEPWPDTEGFLKQSALCLNILYRMHAGRGMSIDLSGGPGLFRFNGEVSSLAYTTYIPTHTYLDYFPNSLTFSVKDKKLGVNVGVALNISVVRGIDVFLSARYFYCPAVSTGIELEELSSVWLDLDEDKDEILAVLDPGPLELNPSFLSLNAGFKLRF